MEQKKLMSNISKFSIGSFVLQVIILNNSLWFSVLQFEIRKQIGGMTTCDISLTDQTHVIESRNSKYPGVSDLYLLSSALNNTKHLNLLCNLYLIKTDSASDTLWYTGYIISFQPVVSTQAGIIVKASCTCSDKISQLYYSVNSDFINIPSLIINDVNTLLKKKILNSLNILQSKNQTFFDSPFWGTGKLFIPDIIAKGGQKPNLDIAALLNKSLNVFQSIGHRQLIPLKPINLGEYIVCNYTLNKLYAGITGKPVHAFLKVLNLKFINSLQGASIYESIMNTLLGDLMLTIKPASRYSNGLCLIIPDYITKFSGRNILLNDMTLCTVTSRLLDKLRTPDVLYINLTSLSCFQTGVFRSTGIYGRYPGKNKKVLTLLNSLRVKSISSPNWLILLLVLKMYQGNKSSDNTPMFTNRQKLLPNISNIQDSNGNVALADAYAKSVFFNMYCKSRMATLVLAVNLNNINIDSFIGSTVKFQCPLGLVDLRNKKDVDLYYGRLITVSYSYKASNSPKEQSSFHISCNLDSVTDVEDLNFKDLFLNGLGTALYTKKEKKKE